MSGRRGVTVPFAVAPMMQHTTTHFRVAMRGLSRRVMLYTEMVHANAVLRGPPGLIRRSELEGAVALQLGGNDPALVAAAAKVGYDHGYAEIDLNVGCPSDRVSSGAFGASLMRSPERVAEIIAAVRAAVPLPVTVKHRIGVDEIDAYEDMERFVETVAAAGADRFTVHARKAWLSGLSPEQNRTVPPLRYPEVHRLKASHPHLSVVINGGLWSLADARPHLEHVDGVMCGRGVIEDPWSMLGTIDADWFGEAPPARTRVEAVRGYLPYAAAEIASGEPIHRVMRPWIPIFTGLRGNRAWRRALAESPHGTLRDLERALDGVAEAQRTV